jgi:hypothetical protein
LKGAEKMTESELQELCSEWQKRLGLAHWRMSVEFGDPIELGTYIANESHQPSFETALIKILKPSAYSGLFPQDMEQSLVHELLHILVFPLKPEGGYHGTQDFLFEQTIDRLARVLVTLKRERNSMSVDSICADLTKVTA